ncbi:HNH endonuclease [Thermodesulfatator indicus DSM 15286]|uniref:HNH endonuclease n=1 Tax=Thermodesulfatator indicus (strain DSM 15286 / JCM 11887 / CIR29812) TaxID=667014 RepID=F8A8K7_THEID|nr:HNH endonuclease [Thermodesulfatator indicus DSM 15286]
MAMARHKSRRDFLTGEDFLKAEREKARKLRQTKWWRRKCASGICYYCGRKFKPSELTMDHLIPLAQGGKSVRENLVPACKECNNKKKYLMPWEWDEYLARLKGGTNES